MRSASSLRRPGKKWGAEKMNEVMELVLSASFGFSVLRLTTPILLAALASVISERVGVGNITMEGTKLISAFTGVVVARTQSDLGFRVQGKILERLVDTGQTVRQGQPLLRLDPADLKLQAQAQQRTVDAAQARARKASSDEARYRGLVASGAVSASEYDQIKAAADSARAELSAARA